MVRFQCIPYKQVKKLLMTSDPRSLPRAPRCLINGSMVNGSFCLPRGGVSFLDIYHTRGWILWPRVISSPLLHRRGNKEQRVRQPKHKKQKTAGAAGVPVSKRPSSVGGVPARCSKYRNVFCTHNPVWAGREPRNSSRLQRRLNACAVRQRDR